MNELKYLEEYSSVNTVKAYKQALGVFLNQIYGEGNLITLASRYISDNRDHESDVKQFLVEINGRPPKTIRLYISAVRTFLMENSIDLPERFWRHLKRKIKGSRAATIDKVPSNVELRRIVMHMPVHGKALYLTLASSGMRIGEALQLDLSDINLDNDPPQINIRREYTKSGDARIAFISGEAKEHIREYLKYREEYLESAVGRSSRHEKSKDDTRLFPFESGTAYYIWNNALEKTELDQKDKSTNRHKLHPHVLRKFFRTRMGAVIPVDITEALIGHKGYLTEVYRRYSQDQLAEFYKKGESAVIVFGKIEENLEIKRDVRKLEAIVHDQREIIKGLQTALHEVEDRLTSLEQERENREIEPTLPKPSRSEIKKAKERLSK